MGSVSHIVKVHYWQPYRLAPLKCLGSPLAFPLKKAGAATGAAFYGVMKDNNDNDNNNNNNNNNDNNNNNNNNCSNVYGRIIKRITITDIRTSIHCIGWIFA